MHKKHSLHALNIKITIIHIICTDKFVADKKNKKRLRSANKERERKFENKENKKHDKKNI
jgi:hypothetical protein